MNINERGSTGRVKIICQYQEIFTAEQSTVRKRGFDDMKITFVFHALKHSLSHTVLVCLPYRHII